MSGVRERESVMEKKLDMSLDELVSKDGRRPREASRSPYRERRDSRGRDFGRDRDKDYGKGRGKRRIAPEDKALMNTQCFFNTEGELVVRLYDTEVFVLKKKTRVAKPPASEEQTVVEHKQAAPQETVGTVIESAPVAPEQNAAIDESKQTGSTQETVATVIGSAPVAPEQNAAIDESKQTGSTQEMATSLTESAPVALEQKADDEAKQTSSPSEQKVVIEETKPVVPEGAIADAVAASDSKLDAPQDKMAAESGKPDAPQDNLAVENDKLDAPQGKTTLESDTPDAPEDKTVVESDKPDAPQEDSKDTTKDEKRSRSRSPRKAEGNEASETTPSPPEEKKTAEDTKPGTQEDVEVVEAKPPTPSNSTPVDEEHKDGSVLVLNSGRFRTVETKYIMNEAARPLSIRVLSSDAQQWMVSGSGLDGTRNFEDKMELHIKAEVARASNDVKRHMDGMIQESKDRDRYGRRRGDYDSHRSFPLPHSQSWRPGMPPPMQWPPGPPPPGWHGPPPTAWGAPPPHHGAPGHHWDPHRPPVYGGHPAVAGPPARPRGPLPDSMFQ